MVSARGIEANPEKIQAIVTMRKPTKLKEIHQLTGRVASLSRFVARLVEKALPFYALIKQGEKFEWNKEADKTFEHLKRTISAPALSETSIWSIHNSKKATSLFFSTPDNSGQ